MGALDVKFHGLGGFNSGTRAFAHFLAGAPFDGFVVKQIKSPY